MWPVAIVLLELVVDDDMRLLCCREPLRIENLPTQRPVEPFVVPVLQGRSRIDADRLDAYSSKPVLHCFRRELGSVVRSDVLRRAVPQ